MKYLRIFALHFQEKFEQRMRLTIWFLISLINSFIMLLYWHSAMKPHQMIGTWGYETFQTYYVALFFTQILMLTHNDYFIGINDIKNGLLSAHLMKPISYVITAICREIPGRILQGTMGLVTIFIISFLGVQVHFVFTALQFILIMCMIMAGIMVSFFLKGLLGALAFWFTETRGFTELFDVLMFLLSGTILPIDLLPTAVKQVALATPFPYVLYYPTLALTGQLSTDQIIIALLKQLAMSFALYLVFHTVWNSGVKKYSGRGQ